MHSKRLLILGGTAEARELAGHLADRDGLTVITSLAGATSAPLEPAGDTRIGGFGGADGLAQYLEDQRIDLVIDATHPFAVTISQNAIEACHRAGRPRLRLQRPPWETGPGDRRIDVPDAAAAAAQIAASDIAFLTIGSKGLDPFIQRLDAYFLARMIEQPEPDLPNHFTLILARPPFTLAGELELIDRYRVTCLVTKNAGGAQTAAKLDAARLRGLPVIMIARPPGPKADAQTVGEMMALVNGHLD